jgi:hypothetical protein
MPEGSGNYRHGRTARHVTVSPDLIGGDVDEGYGKVADVFRRNMLSGKEVGPADRTRVLPLSQPRVAADRRTRQIVLATGPSGALQYAGGRSGWEVTSASTVAGAQVGSIVSRLMVAMSQPRPTMQRSDRFGNGEAATLTSPGDTPRFCQSGQARLVNLSCTSTSACRFQFSVADSNLKWRKVADPP